MSTFDLNTLDTKAAAESGSMIELDDPRTDEPLLDPDGKPYWIEVLGMDSEKLRGVSRKITDRTVNNMRKGKQGEFDSEAADAERAGVYAAATKSWYLPPLDGQVLDCNERNAKRLYLDPRFPWLAEKIDKEIANRKRFFKKASSSS